MIIFAATAMFNVYKGKAKYISASVVMAVLLMLSAGAGGGRYFNKSFYKTLTADTVPIKKKIPLKPVIVKSAAIPDTIKTDTIPSANIYDSNGVRTFQKIDTFNIKFSKDSLDGPVAYHADDSLVMDVPGNKIILYGKKSNVKYQDNELKAPGIIFDQNTGLVTASLLRDSTGKVISSPSFKQKEMTTVSDSIVYNMKTNKGLTKGTYSQQGEMYIYGEKIKKVDTSVFYAYQARLTTCNLDTPHFAFISKKIKFINKKFAVTGPVHPEFEGIPIPIVIPFGIFPMSQGRHSGLIAPAFNANAQLGIALEGLGYYKVLSENFDATIRATLYSYGSWTMLLSPRYYKRYHYQGNFSLDVQQIKTSFKGDPDYNLAKTFNIRWTHSSDTKARPGVSFSANVNAGSSSFNRYVPNSPNRNFSNQLNSSISYTKTWKDKPFNIAVIANHNQNTNSKSINITLPDVSFNVNTLYPFRRPEAVGKLKWYENVGVALNTNAKNQTFFSDDTARTKGKSISSQAADNMQWGATHSIPITLSLPPLGPLQVAPGISYSERWYQQKIYQRWNDTARKVDTSISKGFYAARQMAFSMGVSTRIFGMFGFGKNSHVKAIRHELRPQISASYTPNMNGKYYYDLQSDTFGTKTRANDFSNNTITQAFGEGQFGGLSFSLDNILQMKVKDKKDTSAEATKKVTLLDGLSIGGAYNFLQDSFQLSSLSLSARTNLFDKINITASGSLDPYQNDTTGRRVNELVWKDKLLTLGRLTGGSLSISSQFQGGDKKKQEDKTKSLRNAVNPYTGLPVTDEQAEAAYISNNPADFVDFSIPWSVNVGYSLRFNSVFNRLKKKYDIEMSSDMNFSGTLSLTPKWQVGLNGIYNFSTNQLGMISVSISREMHCWQMSINLSPVGTQRFFSIVISPKSALLRDIKVNRTRNFFDL